MTEFACAEQPAPDGHRGTVCLMREFLALAIRLLFTFAKLLRPGGVRAVAAEPLLVKHQLLIGNRGLMGAGWPL